MLDYKGGGNLFFELACWDLLDSTNIRFVQFRSSCCD